MIATGKGICDNNQLPSFAQKAAQVYPACRKELGAVRWQRLMAQWARTATLNAIPEIIQLGIKQTGGAGYLPELAKLEAAIYEIKTAGSLPTASLEITAITINPTLQVHSFSWRHLTKRLAFDRLDEAEPLPEPGQNRVLIWRHPQTGKVVAQEAENEDWLVLKLVAEKIDFHEAADQVGLVVGALDAAIDRAVGKGLLLSPPSGIRRDPRTHPAGKRPEEMFETASVFTLQWHITQACDLHCKHCYDRSIRQVMDLDQAVRVLDELRLFCKSRYVAGQVSFTGGNPLLYPKFNAIYKAASQRNFAIAILGNPTDEETLKSLVEIQKPVFYQVSLEGLKKHNDAIRGAGHFDRVICFLERLKQFDIYAMVMLTLTKDNMDQVLPLAEFLRPYADLFSFNRLSMIGEGAALQLPSQNAYRAFLMAYVKAAENNPIIGLKDNLINILFYQQQADGFGGCTGYGCGAAFNFVSLLSDGEVHACRKFPSPIGHINRQDFAEIYDSQAAQRYRSGSRGCRHCPIRRVCGGCLAVAYSHGLDIFREVDPQCFF
jgi:selenobiotic family peptide radical SAM maturase